MTLNISSYAAVRTEHCYWCSSFASANKTTTTLHKTAIMKDVMQMCITSKTVCKLCFYYSAERSHPGWFTSFTVHFHRLETFRTDPQSAFALWHQRPLAAADSRCVCYHAVLHCFLTRWVNSLLRILSGRRTQIHYDRGTCHMLQQANGWRDQITAVSLSLINRRLCVWLRNIDQKYRS